MLIIIYSVTRWLMAKNWLVHRKRSIELAAKRTWNKYWVCLKGNVLLFHVCDDGKEVTDDRTPKYRLGDRLQCVIYMFYRRWNIREPYRYFWIGVLTVNVLDDLYKADGAFIANYDMILSKFDAFYWKSDRRQLRQQCRISDTFRAPFIILSCVRMFCSTRRRFGSGSTWASEKAKHLFAKYCFRWCLPLSGTRCLLYSLGWCLSDISYSI